MSGTRALLGPPDSGQPAQPSDRIYLQSLSGELAAMVLSNTATRPSRVKRFSRGTRMRIGDLGFEPLYRDPPSVRTDTPILRSTDSRVGTSFPNDRSPDAHLTFVNSFSRRRRQSSRSLRQSITVIGTDPSCHVKLRGGSVADFHCSIVRDNGNWRVVELFGVGGLRVNGRSTSEADLAIGDVVDIGGFELRLDLGQRALPAAKPAKSADATTAALERMAIGLEDLRDVLGEQVEAQRVQNALILRLLEQGGSGGSDAGAAEAVVSRLEAITEELQRCRLQVHSPQRVPQGLPHSPASHPAALPGPRHAGRPHPGLLPGPTVTSPAPGKTASKPSDREVVAASEVHADISDRIRMLERERRGLLSRLLGRPERGR